MAVPAMTDHGVLHTQHTLALVEPTEISAAEPPPEVRLVNGLTFRPSVVFETYWRFAAARQNIYLDRLGRSWARANYDPILGEHRFTNVFRASDRVSQYLISSVQNGPSGSDEPDDLVFRTLLFKVFNRQQTWEHLESRLGPVGWSTYNFERYRMALDEAARLGPIYSAAYLMPPPRLGEDRKHANHLRLLEAMMRDGLTRRVLEARSLRSVFETLVTYPGLGAFLAFQYAIDLNYSDLLPFDEDDFVVAGPGAKDGIRKCFGPAVAGHESSVIAYMVDNQESHFARLGLSFPGLFGRRLHLIDAQNLFCEVDKYARVRHPEIAGISGRSRIKQKFRPAGPLPQPVFPRRWGLRPPVPDLPANELDAATVEVDMHSAAAVVPESSPRRVAGQDCPLPF
jgi:hypothetical protein